MDPGAKVRVTLGADERQRWAGTGRADHGSQGRGLAGGQGCSQPVTHLPPCLPLPSTEERVTPRRKGLSGLVGGGALRLNKNEAEGQREVGETRGNA